MYVFRRTGAHTRHTSLLSFVLISLWEKKTDRERDWGTRTQMPKREEEAADALAHAFISSMTMRAGTCDECVMCD